MAANARFEATVAAVIDLRNHINQADYHNRLVRLSLNRYVALVCPTSEWGEVVEYDYELLDAETIAVAAVILSPDGNSRTSKIFRLPLRIAVEPSDKNLRLIAEEIHRGRTEYVTMALDRLEQNLHDMVTRIRV